MILKRRPELIPVCLPLHWARRYSQIVEVFGNKEPGSFARDPSTIKSLTEAFRILLTQQQIPIKLCLFIDGLDEYDGSYEDIVDLFRFAAASPHVKVCLSNRPLLVFEYAFSSGDSLRLQDLTYSGIQYCVSNRLSKHPRCHQLLQEEPVRAPELVNEIVRKSDGVIL